MTATIKPKAIPTLGPNGERWRLTAEFRGLATRKWHPCACWFARGEDCDAMGKRWEEQAKDGRVRRIVIAFANAPRVTVGWLVKSVDVDRLGERVFYEGHMHGVHCNRADARPFRSLSAARARRKTWSRLPNRRVFVVRVTRKAGR